MDEVSKPKHAGGRPSKYRPEFCQKLVDFFNAEPYREVEHTIKYKNGDERTEYKEVPNDLPLFSKFAHSIGVNGDTIVEWANKFPEFTAAYKVAKELQENFLMTNGLRDLYAQPFAIFTAKNILSWRDRSEVLEVKFVFEFVSRITSAMNQIIPENCPHCRKPLSLREDTIRQLEQISKDLDGPKAGKP